ncbi:hypothetical protein C8E03_112120 [Lachnotalea glycerini]|jgi:hypothetical protein|uniref:Uncharacterized protein n=1 Tax=Lachnotalea glycerini TaxID=1763509 RepID=A0A318ESY9_9FIRM|nr:DUF6715 family protein [Lachnotalea glycerini]PXV86738.1 hypothetical protein C8E03_112120 [Lachnotalea glycerini]
MKKYKNIIIICVLAALAIWYYFYLSNRTAMDSANKNVTTTEIEDTLAKNIDNVTNTPRAAIKFYSIILQCLYNEDPTEEEITALGEKAREIMDEELINNNPEETYFDALSTEVKEYLQDNKKMIGYVVESSDKVEYYTENGKEYAIVNASYTLRKTNDFTKTNEAYILRKDEEGYWKILGWRIAADEVTDDQNNDE